MSTFSSKGISMVSDVFTQIPRVNEPFKERSLINKHLRTFTQFSQP